eukprot:SAG11_NODE_5004_length_1694_cov_3.457053_1_plen_306_part_00
MILTHLPMTVDGLMGSTYYGTNVSLNEQWLHREVAAVGPDLVHRLAVGIGSVSTTDPPAAGCFPPNVAAPWPTRYSWTESKLQKFVAFASAQGVGEIALYRHDMGQMAMDCVPEWYYLALQRFLNDDLSARENHAPLKMDDDGVSLTPSLPHGIHNRPPRHPPMPSRCTSQLCKYCLHARDHEDCIQRMRDSDSSAILCTTAHVQRYTAANCSQWTPSEGLLDIHLFGAVSDDISFDNSDAISMAVTAIRICGGSVKFPTGRYRVNRTIVLGVDPEFGSYCSFIGQGQPAYLTRAYWQCDGVRHG